MHPLSNVIDIHTLDIPHAGERLMTDQQIDHLVRQQIGRRRSHRYHTGKLADKMIAAAFATLIRNGTITPRRVDNQVWFVDGPRRLNVISE